MPMNYIQFRAMHANAARAAGQKLTKENYARLWNDYKIQQHIQVKPRAPRARKASCKSYATVQACAAPCAWRSKGKKTGCYRPGAKRVLSQQAKNVLRARLAAYRASRPAKAPKARTGKSTAPALFRSSMGFGQFQQTGGFYAQANPMQRAGSYAQANPMQRAGSFAQMGQMKQRTQAKAQHAGAQAKTRAQAARRRAQAKIRAQAKQTAGYWF